jgi:hypothetical protein
MVDGTPARQTAQRRCAPAAQPGVRQTRRQAVNPCDVIEHTGPPIVAATRLRTRGQLSGHLHPRLQDRLVSAQDTASDQLIQQTAADTTQAIVMKDKCVPAVTGSTGRTRGPR